MALAAALAMASACDAATSPSPRAAAITIGSIPIDTALYEGFGHTFTAMVTDASGAPISRPVEWSSSNTLRAMVNSAGVAVGVTPGGSVMIIARADAVADTVVLSVRSGFPPTATVLPFAAPLASVPAAGGLLGGAEAMAQQRTHIDLGRR